MLKTTESPRSKPPRKLVVDVSLKKRFNIRPPTRVKLPNPRRNFGLFKNRFRIFDSLFNLGKIIIYVF